MYILQLFSSSVEGLTLVLLIFAFLVWVIYLVAIANGIFHDNTTKLCWFLIVLFLNVIGVLLFLFWGKKEVGSKKSQSPS
ncbi:MAG: PLDc N-terminal domain-containing protein [Chitinophagaceae bacterium]|nr:PLDc N-terminal domain-containing protein [Chitinophagaceae bacterium]MBK7677987.1 PLDc N-terminal domain-containing protein [Chitinophagaceae bacterium]MBK8301302.1 PLDc N-terminal domain-containing protein [Chitinophagaceae bacterium]MBK9466178.1 PLDc N-terminal domain-containing protein [Chitinophagaceae bacterium]MBK9658368.1 PLDc N-terminal domain-containing protein [Chitinophagaceae bacterium]